jgi:hypothetical protein
MMIFLDPDDPDLAMLGSVMMGVLGPMGLSVTPVSSAAPVAPPAPPQATPMPPPPIKTIHFYPLKKRRNRAILKRFPFLLRVRANFPQRDAICDYLRVNLSPNGSEWHNQGFDFFFTKRTHATMIVALFQGTSP